MLTKARARFLYLIDFWKTRFRLLSLFQLSFSLFPNAFFLTSFYLFLLNFLVAFFGFFFCIVYWDEHTYSLYIVSLLESREKSLYKAVILIYRFWYKMLLYHFLNNSILVLLFFLIHELSKRVFLNIQIIKGVFFLLLFFITYF